jgi:cobalt-zinc-cadmium efflux system protein
MIMSHEHDLNNLTKEISGINKAFAIGLSFNLAYVLVQVIIGLRINSLSLLSDAGHNFLDVAGMALAMVAVKLSNSKSTDTYTYGYKKASILISLLNAVIILVSIGAIGYNAVLRFQNPEPLPGKIISIVAAIGIVINGGSAYLLFSNRDKEINVNNVFLHLASDALVSLGLVAGGIIIYFTHLYWIDPLMSVTICAVIIASMWSVLRESLRLSLDAVPENVDAQKVKEDILKINGIKELHHLHIWAISTTQNAMTGHLVVSENITNAELVSIKEKIRSGLKHLNIDHTTLEIELENQNCEDIRC